ncbi:MAG: hypothetical protein RQ751_10180, partial [Longimicrobiales bacterium]|nr:hypothetical protein [Longimicrobiales bacterium]
PELALLFCSDRATGGAHPQLFRMSADGRGKYRLLTEAGCVLYPQPDGTLVGALQDTAAGGETRLVRARPNPANPRAEWVVEWLAPELRHLDFSADAVPFGGGLLFTATDSAGLTDVFRLLPGTDSVMRLTHDPWFETGVSVDPGSPDGPVVYARWGVTRMEGDLSAAFAAGSDLYAIPLDGGKPKRLTTDPQVDRTPQVRGAVVVFARGSGEGEEEGLMELYLLDLGTLEEVRLTRNDWNDLEPNLTRDGTRLCWQSEEYGHYEMNLRTMDLATRRERVLVDAPGRDTNCHWTPDGRAVVFTGYRTGDANLYLVPAEGGAELPLTRLRSHEAFIGFLPEPTRGSTRAEK